MLDYFKSETPPTVAHEDEDAPLLASCDDDAPKPMPVAQNTKPPLWRKFVVTITRPSPDARFGFDLGTVLAVGDGDPNIHRVVRLNPGSLAEGKLEVGDVVLLVNDICIEYESHEGIVRVISGKDTLKFAVQRKEMITLNGMTQRMVKAQKQIQAKTGEIKYVKSEVMASDVGRRCKVEEFGIGTIKYLGKFHKNGFNRAGVALDEPNGKHNGNVEGYQYFKCKADHGILVKLDKVHVMRWPHEIKAADEVVQEPLGKLTPFKFFDDKDDENKVERNIQRSSSTSSTTTSGGGWLSNFMGWTEPPPTIVEEHNKADAQQQATTFTFAPADEVMVSQSAEIHNAESAHEIHAEMKPADQQTTYEFPDVDCVADQDYGEVTRSRAPTQPPRTNQRNYNTTPESTNKPYLNNSTNTKTQIVNTSSKNSTPRNQIQNKLNQIKAKAEVDPFEQKRQLDFADFGNSATKVVNASSVFDPVQIIA